MIRILHGHVIDILKKLPDESVDCCITSPPYWKVRSFGLPAQVWGGDKDCEHNFIWQKAATETYTLAYRPQDRVSEDLGTCSKCSAFYGNLGAEPHPELWVYNLSLVLKEVSRVLRKTGSLWLNLGDRRATQVSGTLKPKDLTGLPWMMAFHLRDQGLYLRSAIILAKRAPIPESGVDRPITSYDHLFMLTKSSKCYYDGYAVGDNDINYNVKDVWWIDHEYSASLNHFGVFPKELPKRCIQLATSPKGNCPQCYAPYIRVINKSKVESHNTHIRLPKTRTTVTKEWMPSCKCNAGNPVPSVVLDPFAGTGTTSLVAELLGRDSIAIELSEEHVKSMKHRLSRDGGLLVKYVEE